MTPIAHNAPRAVSNNPKAPASTIVAICSEVIFWIVVPVVVEFPPTEIK